MTQLTKTMIDTFRDYIAKEYEKFITKSGSNEVMEKLYKKLTDKLDRIDSRVEKGMNMSDDFWKLKELFERFLSLKINNN